MGKRPRRTLFDIASQRPAASGFGAREVNAVYGYEEARAHRDAMKDWRQRRKLQQADDEAGRAEGGRSHVLRDTERSMYFLSQPTVEGQLPSSDLMKHIFQRTTHLYSQPHTDGLGRKLLDEEAYRAHNEGLYRRGRRRESAGGEQPSDEENDEAHRTSDEDGEEDTASDGSNGRSMRSMVSQQSSRSARSIQRKGSRASMTTEGGRRPTQKQKKMFRAFTGDTLIAMGILMEEFLKHSLHETGYPDPTGGALPFDAASDDEDLSPVGPPVVKRAPGEDAESDGVSSGGSGDPSATSDLSSSDHDEDEDDKSESGTVDSETDSDGRLSRRQRKPKKAKRDPKAEQQHRRRGLFRDEEEAYEQLRAELGGRVDDDDDDDDDSEGE